ncbi:MAG: CRTAC1 family protein [Phycisphaerales bacterium]
MSLIRCCLVYSIACGSVGALAGMGPWITNRSTRPSSSKVVPMDRQLRLENAGASMGIRPAFPAYGMGTGVIAADYDNDGDVDLFVPSRSGLNCQLYQNTDGVFSDVTFFSGIVEFDNARSALWFDANGDDLLDLLIQFDQYQNPGVIGARTVALFEQQADHTFVEVTAGSGLDLMPLIAAQTHGGAMAAGDLNGDDRLDLVITTWDEGVWIFRNDGGMQFTDITEDSPLDGTGGAFWQPVMFDPDGDDDLDVFIAHDFSANPFLDNDGTGSFIDTAPMLGIDTAFNEMGVAVGDSDNDGDFDLYVTNLIGPGEHNVFFTKSDVGIGYSEDSIALGVDEGGWGWGTVFADLDLDGRLDLVEVNAAENEPYVTPWRVWMNRGPMVGTPVYEAQEEAIGFDYDEYGSALAHADFDRDGDLDLVTTTVNGPVRVHRNNATDVRPFNQWLVVKPRMPGTMNTRAIGAVVTVTIGNVSRMRLISAGTSFMSQVPAEAHFGIGNMTRIDEVIVRWPDGTETVLTDVDPDQVLTITPAPAPLPSKGVGRVKALIKSAFPN